MNCPECHAELPTGATYKFCPFCGSRLARRTGSSTAPYAGTDDGPTAMSEAKTVAEIPALADTVADSPAVTAPVARTSTPAASEALTRLELPAVDEPTEAPTVAEMPAVQDDDVVTSVPAAAEPAPTDAKGKKRKFSETAWFMAAVDDEMVEGEAQSFSDQEIMTDRYVPDETLPPGLRKGFSLTLGETAAVSDDDSKGK